MSRHCALLLTQIGCGTPLSLCISLHTGADKMLGGRGGGGGGEEVHE